MGAFATAVNNFARKVEVSTQAVLVSSATEAFNSIVYGSPLTGSPGQPVADVGGGNLRGSWQLEFPGPTETLISTNSVYAESNEDGIARPGGGAYLLRASVGGRFSVRLTRDGFPKIVETETARLTGGG